MADSRLRTGLYLFSQQFGALFKKNVILAQRKKRSTVTQLFGSFIFVFLLFCVVKINNLIDDNDPKSLPIRPFFLAANLFVFMFQINSLVTEKETKRRQTMTLMRLYDSAYWLSWFTWEAILTVFSSFLTAYFGMLFGFDFSLKNSFTIVFLLFFLFQINMLSFAFMLSAFFKQSSSSTTVGFVIFIISFIIQMASPFGFPYQQFVAKEYRIMWSLFPPNLLSEALKLLLDATSKPENVGIRWSTWSDCSPNNNNCIMTIDAIQKWLASTFFLWFILGIYFDNIIPNESGLRKSLFYFLHPSYWMGNGRNNVKESSIFSFIGSNPLPEIIASNDEDVLEEENSVKQQAREGENDPDAAVTIYGLVKTYPKTINIGRRETSPYHAIKGLWVKFAKDKLFCLLGPNGAGKTTLINCLTGIASVTSGDAFIYGHSIRNSFGMSNIQRILGVCPQFDFFWDELSGQEHFHLFASIKGVRPHYIDLMFSIMLDMVGLLGSANGRVGSYSDEMKRRLSIAIAFFGGPKLVFLDEPTTGMDPRTRKQILDIIKKAKNGPPCTVVLTTHSMNEAGYLGDRIGIMVKGRLCCIGTLMKLKKKFGSGVIKVKFIESKAKKAHSREDTVTKTHHSDVKKLVKNILKVEPKKEEEDKICFVIPLDNENRIQELIYKLEERKNELGIEEIDLKFPRLDEVFENILNMAEQESAAPEGRRRLTHILDSGISTQIAV